MKRFLLLSIFLLFAMAFVSAAADSTSVKTFTEPAAGVSLSTLITFNVGSESTDWFSVAFTESENSSFDTDFSGSAISSIPLSVDGKKAINTKPVYVSWILVATSKINVLLKEKGTLTTDESSNNIPFTVSADGVDMLTKHQGTSSSDDYLVLCPYRPSDVYGEAGSKEIKIATDEIAGIANGEYKATISILVESAS